MVAAMVAAMEAAMEGGDGRRRKKSEIAKRETKIAARHMNLSTVSGK